MKLSATSTCDSGHLRRSRPVHEGIVFDIKRYALHDGPGIRTTVFLKGCALRCWWCHNPESQLPQPEPAIRELRLGEVCFTEQYELGKLMSVHEVMTEIDKDRIFFEESKGGVTFSGGEPLMQVEFLHSLLEECGRQKIHRALDTCGYSPARAFDSIILLVDLFLYDVKLMDEEEHISYTGVSNRLILENLVRLSKTGKDVILRLPVIPGITDTESNLAALREFMENHSALRKLELLPYHAIARHKYEKMGRVDTMPDTDTPTHEQMERVRQFFPKNFEVTVRG